MKNHRIEQISRLKRFQPRATDIRYEGKCDVCRQKALYSYILRGDFAGADRSEGRQSCGYYCAHCQWANAGARKFDEDES